MSTSATAQWEFEKCTPTTGKPCVIGANSAKSQRIMVVPEDDRLVIKTSGLGFQDSDPIIERDEYGRLTIVIPDAK